MKSSLQTLLSAAVCAPSGDNLQPWRFSVNPDGGAITFYVDETRDPSPMNVKQLMARVAIGAAIENLIRTARNNSWCVELEEGPPEAVALVRLQKVGESLGVVEQVISKRVTNRRFYETKPVPGDMLERLRQQTLPLESIGTHWIVDRARLMDLAALIGRADALMFSERAMRRAFVANIRFDAPADAPVEEGLSLGSLELSAAERLGLRLMSYMPGMLMKLLAGPIFAPRARKLVESASGLCLIIAPDHLEQTYFLLGRAMQRAWLALTDEGLAVQPMMSLVVLETVAAQGDHALTTSLGTEKLAALAAEFRRLAPEIGHCRPAFLMRLGFAPPPSARTGRLPIERSLS
jgi:nitroreductase